MHRGSRDPADATGSERRQMPGGPRRASPTYPSYRDGAPTSARVLVGYATDRESEGAFPKQR